MLKYSLQQLFIDETGRGDVVAFEKGHGYDLKSETLGLSCVGGDM